MNGIQFCRRFPILFLLISTSCGYHQGNQESLIPPHQTLSIDSIEGDWNGDLAAALVERVTAMGLARYRPCGGDLLLKVALVDFNEKNIDFRYDRHKDGKLRRSIIPTETRLTATAQITLVQAATNTPLLGPIQLKAYVEFDHEYYSSHDEVNVFSLGQLSDYDEAYDAAYPPLILALAQKIADYIAEAW